MRVIGLISGTSADGIDSAIASIQGEGYDLEVSVIDGQTVPYPTDVREQILRVCAGEPISMAALAELDDDIARLFAQAAQALIERHGRVDLIASHGQTVFHRPPRSPRSPNFPLGYSLQLGRGELIAALTQCLTVSDFRQADIAAGGEGAPLVPPVDLALLSHPQHARCIQNIGGIGNVALLPPWDPSVHPQPPKVLGWDTGPGNSLLDLAVETFSEGRQTYDHNGTWAAQGVPCQDLVEKWLQHPYFQQLPPKSTGRELFGQDFWNDCLREATPLNLLPADILATLTEFTALSIAQSYRTFLPALPSEMLVCGGGSRNAYLINRLQVHLPEMTVQTTSDAGVPADLKEALAFAVLGYWHCQRFPGNLPSVTGASQAVPLGKLHKPI
ncbi:anhydro-N-acetylmuramic acid kinase [Oscillatoria sp. CS-180]|uniref:anhydro-N-acetylmuramic acid kinase n=1 Tax=Oscillatoria sp. CS-180 TaxID=3021720 RepID=UPI00232E1CBA|nr:anhydro-N-acetylmuramic acid kinase [Oscillatoria sp. CS-180]MDB9525927.1 anhydro-N-acetylmuramic acid kinase [Oscillatoria sp. CS-180]